MATTYYVRAASGSDLNAGTSFAAAFQSIQKALDTAVGGDAIRLCDEEIFAAGATIDIDTNLGTGTAPIDVYGASEAGGGSLYNGTGQAVISAALSPLISCTIAAHMRWHDVRITAAATDNFAITGGAYIEFRRCRFDSATSDGLYTETNAGNVRFVDCEIDSNGGAGLNALASGGRGRWRLVRCTVHGNTGNGCYSVGQLGSFVALGSQFYNNGGHGIQLLQGLFADMYGNTFYGNTGNGIDLSSSNSFGIGIVNNSFVANGGYGIDTNAITSWLGTIEGNHFYGNTSGDMNITYPGLVSASGDPLFNDPANADFTPLRRSPLIGAGLGGADIGAVSRLRWKGGPFSRPALGPADLARKR